MTIDSRNKRYTFAFMTAYPKSHLKAAMALAVILAIVITALPAQQKQPDTIEPVSLDVAIVTEPTPMPEIEPLLVQQQLQPESQWIHIRVKEGDNLARIFKRINLPAADLQNIIDLGKDVASLKKIIPGQELSFLIKPTGELESVRYKKNAFDTLYVDRQTNGFAARWEAAEPEKIIVFEKATITEEHPSLYQAGKAAGLSDNIIMKLSYVFQWDISFALDMRLGDSFSLMYEEVYVEGEKVKEGDIVAATFNNMGRSHKAVRYSDLTGRTDYYTPSGLSMRKAFLRDPVHFSHVSSSFNLKRMHPINKRVMPHRGIDYAAKRGTPVVASGDGKVTIKRQNNASGRYVVIQHGEQYTTKYLHLNAFARGIKPGATVKQGQTIGYVGSSGWATGPHLHYEFLVGGVHRNPRTVKLPQASPVPEDEMGRFRASTNQILAQLDAITGTGYASAGSTGNAPAGGGD